MSLCKHNVHGMCFSCMFEKRPDLEAPGYHETIQQIKEESTDEPTEDDQCLQVTR